MSLRFAYVQAGSNRPPFTFSGPGRRPRPVIDVTLIGPAGTQLTRGLLDTGADDTVFPESLAVALGVDLTGAPSSGGQGATGTSYVVRYALVTLRIADRQEQPEWEAWVGFTPARLRQALLGYAGFLEFFTARFLGDQDAVELTANSLYPGK